MTTSTTSTPQGPIELFAHSKVGCEVRLVRPHPLPPSPWGRISMALVSGERWCWMISYFDDSIDVQPVRTTAGRYEFR
ncbi:hypothetical protein [Rhodococcus aetherivorans]|uniref:hypothetical protein n=1 Tax=Rhodococcus aetherivorans TaxID=191292 RepID=UPI001639E229|nr:hypothetical protein [Rhodococcus aetherivorans]MBC2586903.1 hypothetical protein [Rhodococcus aetherivorans]